MSKRPVSPDEAVEYEFTTLLRPSHLLFGRYFLKRCSKYSLFLLMLFQYLLQPLGSISKKKR
jgi:hypothetical protein